MDVAYITPSLAVASAPTAGDIVRLAELGFRSLVNNRPDGEQPEQLAARQEAVMAWRAGIAYRHVPATSAEVLDEPIIERLADALSTLPAPVLLHCRSGRRSAILWAAASVRGGADLDCVLAATARAGFDLTALHDELAALAGRTRSLSPVEALDCDPPLTLPQAA